MNDSLNDFELLQQPADFTPSLPRKIKAMENLDFP
jgi:hypothetical protein